MGETDVEELTLPIGIRGAMDNPRITFDDRDLADALATAGRRELESRVRDEIRDRVGEDVEDRARDEVEERGRDLLDRFRR